QFEHQEQNDEEDIVSFTDKIVALYRTAIIKQDKSFCILAKHVNIAVCILLGTFAQFDEQLEKDIFDFVIQQTILHTQDWPYEVDANLFRLILNVIDLADHDSCVILAIPTKDNFEDSLKLFHHFIVNSYLSCHDRKKLVFNWLAQIIDALPQEDNELLPLTLLLRLSHAIIDIGNSSLAYSDEEQIGNLCCHLLNKIVKRQCDLDAIWKFAQFCVMNKLKTSLGKPQETFLALEETLQFFAWSIVNNTKTVESSSSEQTNRSLTPSSTTNLPVTSSSSSSSSSEVNLPTDKALKKCMYEGAALSLPQFPKTIKFFFITNKSTCLEWVNRIRIPIILTAVCSGQYESAVRNSNQCLMHVCALGKAEVYDCYLSLHQWPELITWNDTCIQMQIPFLQDHKKDLRITMKTTIDINAIRAMSYFENRDFYGLKVAMRKMPNSQAIGEELGRNISCSWDMEPFDMLAPVEKLKGVSKRRSGLWSLNAVLQ
ncbi:unnamed protein product, partial [Rotaria sp. Silwood1]